MLCEGRFEEAAGLSMESKLEIEVSEVLRLEVDFEDFMPGDLRGDSVDRGCKSIEIFNRMAKQV